MEPQEQLQVTFHTKFERVEFGRTIWTFQNPGLCSKCWFLGGLLAVWKFLPAGWLLWLICIVLGIIQPTAENCHSMWTDPRLWPRYLIFLETYVSNVKSYLYQNFYFVAKLINYNFAPISNLDMTKLQEFQRFSDVFCHCYLVIYCSAVQNSVSITAITVKLLLDRISDDILPMGRSVILIIPEKYFDWSPPHHQNGVSRLTKFHDFEMNFSWDMSFVWN